jgi:hypothetical protein
MTDYKVDLVEDNISEFHVEFKGPVDSEIAQHALKLARIEWSPVAPRSCLLRGVFCLRTVLARLLISPLSLSLSLSLYLLLAFPSMPSMPFFFF